MSLLSELLAESAHPANSASPANLQAAIAPRDPEISKLAELAGPTPSSLIPDTTKVRAHLLALADADYLDAARVRALPESELAAIAEQLADYDADRLRDALRVYLRTLAEDAEMRAGRLPPAYDTPALCRHCGPVWLPAPQVACLDVVDGWPVTYGCPWCFVHLPEGHRIPRPCVTCAECQHYQPDTINPAQGMGRCAIDANHGGTTWPHQSRTCATFNTKEPKA